MQNLTPMRHVTKIFKIYATFIVSIGIVLVKKFKLKLSLHI